jgi:hypothetical protein
MSKTVTSNAPENPEVKPENPDPESSKKSFSWLRESYQKNKVKYIVGIILVIVILVVVYMMSRDGFTDLSFWKSKPTWDAEQEFDNLLQEQDQLIEMQGSGS